MTTEEKIKRYEELHPEGKAFPTNKKPDERAEDMQWLDEKIAEFEALKAKEAENPDQDTNTNPETTTPSTPTITVAEEVKVYTVDQIKCLPEPKLSEMIKLAEEGKIKVVNQL